jgi:hypothetical protein
MGLKGEAYIIKGLMPNRRNDYMVRKWLSIIGIILTLIGILMIINLYFHFIIIWYSWEQEGYLVIISLILLYIGATFLFIGTSPIFGKLVDIPHSYINQNNEKNKQDDSPIINEP